MAILYLTNPDPNRVRLPNHVREPAMPGMLVVVASAIMLLIAPAWAQSNPAEQEVLQIRQKMARSFAEAVNNKDGMQAADQYSNDVVFSLLVPVQTIVLGKRRCRNVGKPYSRRAQLQSIQARPRRCT